MIDRRDPDYDDEKEYLSIDELADRKALHDEEEYRERITERKCVNRF